MKLAVVGSRDFDNYTLMKKYLDKIHSVEPISHIISGGARGADSLSERWAKENDIETIVYIPDWNKYKKRAGYLRNVDIITNADKVIAFWDGVSKGTLHSINLADKQKKKIKVVYF